MRSVRQFIKYIIVGLINTAIYYGIYYFMIRFGFSYALSLTAGTIAGIINSYFWNKYFTFLTKKITVSETAKFLIVYGAQYLSNLLIIYICVEHVGISKELAGLAAIGIGTFIGYFGHKFWSFKKFGK
jgi:putative flippase GtrA